MEWVDGWTLRSLLEKGSITRVDAVHILSQLCDVLIHIHNHDVVHRDLRPDNVVLTTAGLLKLVNFDRARMEGSDLTTIATRIGRQMDERYVAPEVWKEPSSTSKTSDIFSFGIMLHELITGRTPYEQLREFLIARKLESRMMMVAPPVDPYLNDIFLRMCSYETTNRISDLNEVKEAIEILL
jgi:eukaryotic-like serine/threonine-protein kinase